MKQTPLDLVIIGAGPAGLTAALYAGRYRLHTLLLEKISPGGQIILSASIENYPGFPGGIATSELMDKFQKQVSEVGITPVAEEVVSVLKNDSGNSFKVATKENTYTTKSVIVATGAQSKRLDVPGEEKLIGRGVSYCGTCDAPLFRNKEVAVIGGGDRALEEAILLSAYASKVTLIHRRNAFRASKILEEKARANPKIQFSLNAVVSEIVGSNKVEAVKVKDVVSSSEKELICQGVFIFVGIVPFTSFLANTVALDEAGFVMTDEKLKTSKEGIFACGDCRKKALYQVVNACGEAAVAAHSVHEYVMKL
jgi:thioredoxin reductase (NADPH)